MLAPHHVARFARDGGDPRALAGVSDVLAMAGVASLAKPKTAVFVGVGTGPDVSLKLGKSPRVYAVLGLSRLAARRRTRTEAHRRSRGGAHEPGIGASGRSFQTRWAEQPIATVEYASLPPFWHSGIRQFFRAAGWISRAHTFEIGPTCRAQASANGRRPPRSRRAGASDRRPPPKEDERATKCERICASAGTKNVRRHDSRHNCASLGAAGGLSLRVIGALLDLEQHASQRYPR